ncbi:hypothetical protein SHA53_003101 [Salmonella enterica]|nr:hypothetical protein [Salmonella enterica]
MWSDSVLYYFRNFQISVLDKVDGMSLGKVRLEIRNVFECLHKMDKVLYTAFLRECEGSYKNYAAASDILRLFVLHEYGGLYPDLDVKLAVSVFTPGYIRSSSGFAVYDTTDLTYFPNAVIATSKGHPWLKLMLGKISEQYSSVSKTDVLEAVSPTWSIKRSNLRYDKGRHVVLDKHNTFNFESDLTGRKSTTAITGPGLLVNILKQHGLLTLTISLKNYIRPIDASGKWVITHRMGKAASMSDINDGHYLT